MVENEIAPLRVLIATEGRERLDLLAELVAALGHEVISREIDVRAVAAVAAGSVRMSLWWSSVSPCSTRSASSSRS
jgi:hypothetical protein